MDNCITGAEGAVVLGTWSVPKKDKRRWSAALKKELVMRLLRGEPVHGVSREMSVPEYKLERWRNCALVGIDVALRERESDSLQTCLEDAYRRISELSMEVEQLRKHARPKRPVQDKSRIRGASYLSLEASAS